jgi:PAS domain S-box-containing protein
MSPLSIDQHHSAVEWLFSAIVKSFSDAIWVENLEGVVVSWNAAAERMFGTPATEAIGQSGRYGR